MTLLRSFMTGMTPMSAEVTASIKVLGIEMLVTTTPCVTSSSWSSDLDDAIARCDQLKRRLESIRDKFDPKKKSEI